MSDLDELMRLRAATATPALEQLCWYDVKPEQANFFEACLEDLPKLQANVAELVKAAQELVDAADQAAAFVAHVRTDLVDALIAALKPFEGS